MARDQKTDNIAGQVVKEPSISLVPQAEMSRWASHAASGKDVMEASWTGGDVQATGSSSHLPSDTICVIQSTGCEQLILCREIQHILWVSSI